jgi:hypothetical protein
VGSVKLLSPSRSRSHPLPKAGRKQMPDGVGLAPRSQAMQKTAVLCWRNVHRTERKVLPAVQYPWNWNGDCLIGVLLHANVGTTWTRREPGLREVRESN